MSSCHALLITYLSLVHRLCGKFQTSISPPPSVDDSETPVVVQVAAEEQRILKRFLSCLHVVDRVVANWEHWEEYTRNLLRSLSLQDREVRLLSESQQRALELLQSKGMEDDYLGWLVGNATSDFVQLLHEAEEVLTFLPQVQEVADFLESPPLKVIVAAMTFYSSDERVAHRRRLCKMLEEANASRLPHLRLRRFALFLHTFLKYIKFPPHTTSIKHAIARIARYRRAINQMKDLESDLESFTKNREEILRIFAQSILSVVRMMLKTGEDPQSWLVDYFKQPEETAGQLVPSDIDGDQLLIGVAQSLSLIEDMEHRLKQTIPHLEAVERIAQLLESPVIKSLTVMDKKRIEAWRQIRSQWVGLLNQMEEILSRKES